MLHLSHMSALCYQETLHVLAYTKFTHFVWLLRHLLVWWMGAIVLKKKNWFTDSCKICSQLCTFDVLFDTSTSVYYLQIHTCTKNNLFLKWLFLWPMAYCKIHNIHFTMTSTRNTHFIHFGSQLRKKIGTWIWYQHNIFQCFIYHFVLADSKSKICH